MGCSLLHGPCPSGIPSPSKAVGRSRDGQSALRFARIGDGPWLAGRCDQLLMRRPGVWGRVECPGGERLQLTVGGLAEGTNRCHIVPMSSVRINTGNGSAAAEVRGLRALSGLSQPAFAVLVDRSLRTIKRWESGECEPEPLALRELRRRFVRDVDSRSEQPSFRFVDLFAGIGGLRLGFEAIGGQCGFTSEWDAHAQRTYRELRRSRHCRRHRGDRRLSDTGT